MEIQVIGEHGNIVQVCSTVGCFSGIWCSFTPVVSKRYVVELDIDDVLIPDAIELSNSFKPCIECVEQTIYITGFVEEIQDEVMTLRLHKALVMIETSCCSNFAQYIGRYVRIRVSEIKLYDTGIY